MKTHSKLYSRREMLRYTTGLTGSIFCAPFGKLWTSSPEKRFNIGACDWSIGKRGGISAFALAQKIGLDGIQVSFARSEEDLHLLRKDVQHTYRQTARKHGVKIGGLALGILNKVPYKSDSRTEQWVSDSIDVADALGCKVILLAFFAKGDIKGDKEGTREVIRRLRKVAPKAKEKDIVLGIESWLSAPEHMEIIEAVDSEYVKVYYDVANSQKMGYNIYKEIRQLGDNICEFHAKENGYLLGKGRVDFKEVRRAIDDIGYSGWIHIEGAVPSEKGISESYISNVKFMHSL